MDTRERRLDYFLLNDYMRAVDENYFVYEIYPGLGMFRWYDTAFDMKFKCFGALASGAKGLLYWQYRAERIGHEGDCAGLVRMDGSPRAVAYAVRDFGETLKKNMKYFANAEAKPAEVAIVFDFDCMLMSEIEDACGKDFSFAEKEDALHYYRKAHAGMYRLLHDSDYGVDYIGTKQVEKFENYKVLYFPYYTILDENILPALCNFVEKGGVLIADEGFGMRQPNTWMQPYDIACKPLFTARLSERRTADDGNGYIDCDGTRVKVGPYISVYDASGGEIFLRFQDDSAGVRTFSYGKGKIYLFGFSLGYSYYESQSGALAKIAEKILKEAAVSKNLYSDEARGLYERRLTGKDYEVVFLFNAGDEERTVCVKEELMYGSAQTTLHPQSVGYFVVKR